MIEDNDFSDFHLEVRQTRPISHGFRPHAVIHKEGGFKTPPFPISQAVAQLEWSLNGCIFSPLFDRLLIHGGVLERNGRALVIVGESGAGKSTLTAALCLNDWRLLSDELTIVSPTDGLLTGLARPVALKNNSIALIQSISPDAHIGPISPDTSKGDVAHLRPPPASVLNVDKPAKLNCFAFVHYEPDRPIRAQEVTKARAFMSIAQHAAINYSVLGEVGFNTLTRAIDSAICYDFHYGDIREAIDFFCSEKWYSAKSCEQTLA